MGILKNLFRIFTEPKTVFNEVYNNPKKFDFTLIVILVTIPLSCQVIMIPEVKDLVTLKKHINIYQYVLLVFAMGAIALVGRLILKSAWVKLWLKIFKINKDFKKLLLVAAYTELPIFVKNTLIVLLPNLMLINGKIYNYNVLYTKSSMAALFTDMYYTNPIYFNILSEIDIFNVISIVFMAIAIVEIASITYYLNFRSSFRPIFASWNH